MLKKITSKLCLAVLGVTLLGLLSLSGAPAALALNLNVSAAPAPQMLLADAAGKECLRDCMEKSGMGIKAWNQCKEDCKSE
ncbi:MAG: hypothetical protein AB4352_29345 [Hormoscilla sp.]